jgi:hypothetical protein
MAVTSGRRIWAAVIVVGVLSGGLSHGNDKTDSTARAPSTKPKVIESETRDSASADQELYGADRGALDDKRTSHFNFDNRVFPGEPNPPKTEKYRCFVECVLDSGRRVHYGSNDLRRIPVGEYRTLDVNEKNVRVIKCRFWWKLTPRGRLEHSQWVEADKGNYIVYVFLVWRGTNDYVIDSLTQEPIVVRTAPAQRADPTAHTEDLFTIAQQSAYHVDPIKLRPIGRPDFQVHRIEVTAKVPGYFRKPPRKGDHDPDGKAIDANGKMTFYGRCTKDEGLWHWGDCARYDGSFSIDIRVNRRFEQDPSGLNRPGYVIRAVRQGALHSIDEDGRFLFFNGPPTTTQGPHSADCPYRLVINAKEQNKLVQTISMEPLYRAPMRVLQDLNR